MTYTKTLELQEMRLRLASGYAQTILKCDEAIEAGNHLNYFRTLREETIPLYADTVADIVEASIDTAMEFSKSKFSTKQLLETINVITDNYRTQNNISY